MQRHILWFDVSHLPIGFERVLEWVDTEILANSQPSEHSSKEIRSNPFAQTIENDSFQP